MPQVLYSVDLTPESASTYARAFQLAATFTARQGSRAVSASEKMRQHGQAQEWFELAAEWWNAGTAVAKPTPDVARENGSRAADCDAETYRCVTRRNTCRELAEEQRELFEAAKNSTGR